MRLRVPLSGSADEEEKLEAMPPPPPQPEDSRAPAPRTIGRYSIYGEIAAGGMATVHFGRLVGAVGFTRRHAAGESPAKRALVQHLEQKLGYRLDVDSPPGSQKLIVATWHDADALLL